MTIFGEGFGKFDINADNFWHNGSNSIKITLLESSHQNLSNDIYLFGSTKVRIFPLFSIVFGNGIIMTSFLVT